MATKFHRQALADARSTEEEAKANATAAASPTAAVTVEMEPASAKETNDPSRASNGGRTNSLTSESPKTLNVTWHGIGHVISWVIALSIGFHMYSMNEERVEDTHMKDWFVLAPVSQFLCVLLVAVNGLITGQDCGQDCGQDYGSRFMAPGDCDSLASALYSQLLVLLALTGFGLSIVVGGHNIIWSGDDQDRSTVGGWYIFFSANATAFTLINRSKRLVLNARSPPQP
jgi:hypothetical protein